MTRDELRAAFKEFCGTNRYWQFVEELHDAACRGKRLEPWQEELWGRFAKTTGEDLPQSVDAIHAEFRQCFIHCIDLEPGRAEIAYGLIREPSGEFYERAEYYPFGTPFVFGGCRERTETTTQVLFCPQCRKEFDRRFAEP
jgi:hypothetical protein